LYRGFFAYIPKKGEENSEPPHAICPNCYQSRQRSFLQREPQWIKHAWDCPECKTHFRCANRNMGDMIEKARRGVIES